MTKTGRIANGERPFRAPHCSVTAVGMLGGGRPVRPGEVTLAHGGVLFLEDVQEFAPTVLQALRQPDDHRVRKPAYIIGA